MFAWSAYSVAMRKHFSFAFVLFFLLQLNFFPLQLRHQRSANKIRHDGAPSFTGNPFIIYSWFLNVQSINVINISNLNNLQTIQEFWRTPEMKILKDNNNKMFFKDQGHNESYHDKFKHSPTLPSWRPCTNTNLCFVLLNINYRQIKLTQLSSAQGRLATFF